MSEIEVKKYNLPDAELYLTNTIFPNFKIWIPTETSIVLGKSNNPQNSLIIDNVLRDKIPIYKRNSGGETVLLSDKMISISAAIIQTGFKSGKTYFQFFNNKIIKVLKNFEINDLFMKGISDISINDKKVLGSAIYQNKNLVFYHGILNISESIELIGKYIKHPQREPDYRQNRDHTDFVTSLQLEGYKIDQSNLLEKLNREFQNLDNRNSSHNN